MAEGTWIPWIVAECTVCQSVTDLHTVHTVMADCQQWHSEGVSLYEIILFGTECHHLSECSCKLSLNEFCISSPMCVWTSGLAWPSSHGQSWQTALPCCWWGPPQVHRRVLWWENHPFLELNMSCFDCYRKHCKQWIIWQHNITMESWYIQWLDIPYQPHTNTHKYIHYTWYQVAYTGVKNNYRITHILDGNNMVGLILIIKITQFCTAIDIFYKFYCFE